MSAARFSRALALVSCLMLCDCILITDHDLHIVRIEDVTAVTTQAPPARSWQSEGGILTIVFMTDLDVIAHAAGYETSHTLESSICRHGDFDGKQLLDDLVYFRDVDDSRQDWAQNPPGAEALQYRYRIQLTRHHISSDATPSYDYDLRAQPQDICFRIRGARMLGRGYVSNTMTVPAAAIADAIHKAGG